MNTSIQSAGRRGSRRTRPGRTRPGLTREALELVAVRFRAMGEPLRLQLLHELESGEQSVSVIAENVQSTQPNVSKHLKILQDAGLVKRRQHGTTVFYSIADEMVLELCDMVCSRLHDRLEAQVDVIKALSRGRF